jgi:hypothetical protein
MLTMLIHLRTGTALCTAQRLEPEQMIIKELLLKPKILANENKIEHN